jgi:hypothetical protein
MAVSIGIGPLVLGLALAWFGMPNKAGENPRFLRGGLMQMLYPATVVTFVVIGVAKLVVSL